MPEVLPADKVAVVQSLQGQGHVVAMAGRSLFVVSNSLHLRIFRPAAAR